MQSVRSALGRWFGARPTETAPTEPIEIASSVGEFEAGAIVARLALAGIDAIWPPSVGHGRSVWTELRGSVFVRYEDLDRANEVLRDVQPLGGDGS